MSDDFEEPIPQQTSKDQLDSLYCNVCGKLVQQDAIQDENQKWQLGKRCPDATPNNNHLMVHIADEPYVVSRRIINPDSIDEVNDNKFTTEEIDSIINNSLL